MLNGEGPEGYGAAGIAGAIFYKIIDVVLKNRRAESAQIRDELRADVDRLQKQVKELFDEIGTWRTKYYALHEENISLRAECKELRSRLDDLAGDRHKPELPSQP